MSTNDKNSPPKPPAKPAAKPLTGAALDRALKAGLAAGHGPVEGAESTWAGKGRRSDAPASRIRYIPKRGK